METYHRKTVCLLTEELVLTASSYGFFQLINRLEACLNDNDFWDSVNIVPTSEVQFPATDIQRIEVNEKITIYVNFLGLYGVNSPFPHYLIYYGLSETDNGKAWRAYLDIFNSLIYEYFYRGLKKYQPLAMRAHELKNYQFYLTMIGANRLQKVSYPKAKPLFLTNSRVSHFSGLVSALSNMIMGPLSVTQYVQSWILVKVNPLGNELTLGDNSFLGTRALDGSSSVLITLDEFINDNEIPSWLNPDFWCQLRLVLSKFLPMFVQSELTFNIHVKESTLLYLGCDQVILGWKCWLGCGANGIARYGPFSYHIK